MATHDLSDIFLALDEVKGIQSIRKQLEAASEQFGRKWKGILPVHPLMAEWGCELASVVDLVGDDVRLVTVQLNDSATLHPYEISGDVFELDGHLAVRDNRGRVRLLTTLGLLPNRRGIWTEDCITLVDTVHGLSQGVMILHGLGFVETAEAIQERIKEEHGGLALLINLSD